ncbi:MAG: SagB/ThcOx family dehydrogenase [Ignavibacteria bacterium]|nr:SagB/ThcOx family dehydrogenase [Ignavibacteria bacterium]
MFNKKILIITILVVIIGLIIISISTNAFDRFICSSSEKTTEIQNPLNKTEENQMTAIEENNSEAVNSPLKSKIKLPEPQYSSNTSIEEALLKRKSIRDYQKKSISLENVSQILWAAQGITNKAKGKRTAPSAGALYPLEIYLLVGNVNDLASGIYKYKPEGHELILIAEGDRRNELSKYSAQPEAIQDAPITLVISAVYKRTSAKYGERASRYVHIEVGHSAQNVCLQIISLGLSTVTIGAFQDGQVKKAVQLLENEDPLYIMPIGFAK